MPRHLRHFARPAHRQPGQLYAPTCFPALEAARFLSIQPPCRRNATATSRPPAQCRRAYALPTSPQSSVGGSSHVGSSHLFTSRGQFLLCDSGLGGDEPTRTASGGGITGGPSEDGSASPPGEDPVVQDVGRTRQAARGTTRGSDCQGENRLQQLMSKNTPAPEHVSSSQRQVDELKRDRDL